MEKQLTKLVKTTEFLRGEAKTQSTVLNAIYKLNEQQVKENKQIITLEKEQLEETKKQTKAQEKAAKEQKRRDKVKASDKGGLLDQIIGKDKDKVKNKGLFGGIMDALFGGLGAAIGLKAGIVALAAAAGVAITAYIKSPEFRKNVNEYIIEPLGEVLKEAAKGLLGNEQIETPTDVVNETGRQIYDVIDQPISDATRSSGTKQIETMRDRLGVYEDGEDGAAKKKQFDELGKVLELFKRKDQLQGELLRSRNDFEKSDEEMPWWVKSLGLTGQYREKARERFLERDKQIREISEDIKKRSDFLNQLGFVDLPGALEYQRKQLGGFIGTVPGQGGNGDRFKTLVEPGSVVLNQRAAGFFQSGGMVPVMLEQGEKVFSPSDPMAGAALAMNSLIPRFQEGGKVDDGASRGSTEPKPPTDKADLEKEEKGVEETKGKKGTDAILAAAENNLGLAAGQGEQCANTTRAVLAEAGHPAANKVTQIGDLDPEGTAYNGPGYAASFAGTDMGSVVTSIGQVQPGMVMLWKDTYKKFADQPAGAITHVGIAGEGNTQYDHSRSTGWEKVPRESSNFVAGIDLNGEATGLGGLYGAGMGGALKSVFGTIRSITDIIGQLSSMIAQALFGIGGDQKVKPAKKEDQSPIAGLPDDYKETEAAAFAGEKEWQRTKNNKMAQSEFKDFFKAGGYQRGGVVKMQGGGSLPHDYKRTELMARGDLFGGLPHDYKATEEASRKTVAEHRGEEYKPIEQMLPPQLGKEETKETKPASFVQNYQFKPDTSLIANFGGFHGEVPFMTTESGDRYPVGSGVAGGGLQQYERDGVDGVKNTISSVVGTLGGFLKPIMSMIGDVTKGIGEALGISTGGSDSGGGGSDTPQASKGGGSTSYTAGGVPKKVENDAAFKKEVTRVAKRFNIPEKNLYAVMSFETGGSFDPAQKNMAGSGATGLIQFMPSTAKGLGTSTAELAGMNRAQQMKYVEKYFAQSGLPQGASFEDLYMSILYPRAVGKPNDYKLFGKGGDMPGAYAQNKGLDANNDGTITKYEAAAKARKHLQEGGIANIGRHSANNARTAQMVSKTQEDFAQEIGKAVQPTVIPIPMGGGGSNGAAQGGASATPFPNMTSEDTSIMAMEYKYRITMGASV